ncbi:MAG: MscL family protein [Methanospirillum sp.]|nr:MscL family protein [Methanospirillum sp.]
MYPWVTMSMMKEFLDFLKEYKVVSLAVAFIMGVAATALVKSFVDNLIMPWVAVLTPGGDWKEAVLVLGPVKLGIGPFAAECINFIIIALVVFLIAKHVMKEEAVTKK